MDMKNRRIALRLMALLAASLITMVDTQYSMSEYCDIDDSFLPQMKSNLKDKAGGDTTWFVHFGSFTQWYSSHGLGSDGENVGSLCFRDVFIGIIISIIYYFLSVDVLTFISNAGKNPRASGLRD